jgi:hypothetical protein
MRVQQVNAQPTPSSVLPINASAIMPPLTPQTQPAASPSAATPRAQTQPAPAAPLPAGRPLPPAGDRQ